VVGALATAGHEVVSIARNAAPGLPAEQVCHDLMSPERTRELFVALRPDAVVHLAAIAVPFSRPEVEIWSRNTTMTFAVLEATIASGADRLLVSSSPTVIGYNAPHGWVPARLPIDEDHPTAPWNGYAASKLAMEHIVAMGVRRVGEEVRLGVFRPCYVVSPEEWAGAPTQQGHTIEQRLADPALSAVALFNYVDARDAGEFVRVWLDQARDIPNGSCCFVGATDALAVRPLAELMPGLVPGVTREAAAGLVGTSPAFDVSRAERLVGWRAARSWRTELPASVVERLTTHG
jgi:nucleoside-diphosphate-sugar epimerase